MTTYNYTIVFENGTLRQATQIAGTKDEAIRLIWASLTEKDQRQVEWYCFESQDAPDAKRETLNALWDACIVFPVWCIQMLIRRK